MRQTLSRLFRANIANSSRTLIMGATTASLFMWQYKQNKLPFMSNYAHCAALPYTLPSQSQIEACQRDLMEFIEDEKYLAPLLIRLSWHDAGTYDKADGSGGPRACMRFPTGE